MSLVAKVCGLTCAEDAAMALEAGADLLGFVVHPASPRHCADVRAASAPARDRAVLVMVAEEADPILRAAEQAGVQRVQPYLPKPEAALARLEAAGLSVILPWPDDPGRAPRTDDRELTIYLWEPSLAQTGVHGGSGLAHAFRVPPPGPFFLAGGLDGASLAARVAAVPPHLRPWLRGVDAASRLESSPGRKDPAKVRAFVSALRGLA